MFSALGVFILLVVGIIYLAWMRRKRRNRQTEPIQSMETAEKTKRLVLTPHLARTLPPSPSPPSDLQARVQNPSASAEEWWRLHRLRSKLGAKLPLIPLFGMFGRKSANPTVGPGQNDPNDSIQFHMGLGLGYAPTREDDSVRMPSLPATERRHPNPV